MTTQRNGDQNVRPAGGSVHGVGPSTVLGNRYAVQRRLGPLPRRTLVRPRHHPRTQRGRRLLGEDDPHAAATLDAPAGQPAWTTTAWSACSTSATRTGPRSTSRRPCPRRTPSPRSSSRAGCPPRRPGASPVRRPPASRPPAPAACTTCASPPTRCCAPNSTVKVRGVAASAAMASDDDLDSASAARVDAVGVVALAYAALTSRWPLPTPAAGSRAHPGSWVGSQHRPRSLPGCQVTSTRCAA